MVEHGQSYVTNMITAERIGIPREWVCELSFNEDGTFAEVLCENMDGDNRFYDCNEKFKLAVLSNADGEYFILDRTSEDPVPQPLEELLSQHRVADVSFKYNAGSASYDFVVAVMNKARPCNSRVFWSLNCLFTHLGLKPSYQYPSAWLDDKWEKFEKHIDALMGSGGAQQLIRSNSHFDASSATVKNALPYTQRCTEHPTISTAGLMANLTTMCALDRWSGGVHDPHVRDNCRNVLNGLIGIACEDGGFAFVVGVGQYECPWPRPCTSEQRLAMLRISGQQIIDFNGLLQHPHFKTWTTWLSGMFNEGLTADLRYVLPALRKSKALLPLLGQLIFQLATRVEHRLSSVEVRLAGDHLQFGAYLKKFDWRGGERLTGAAADARAARYLWNACVGADRSTVVFAATDKGNICKLPLAATVVQWDMEHVVIAPPVVPRRPSAPISFVLCHFFRTQK